MKTRDGSDHDQRRGAGSGGPGAAAASPGVGKRTLTESLPPAPSTPAGGGDLVLREADGTTPALDGARPSDATVAKSGFRGAAGSFPDLPQVNAALGGDFSGVPVHTGAEANAASRELGANAYTHGGMVAFKTPRPSLDTQIHEATHLAQLGHVKVDTAVAGGGSVSALEHEASATASAGGAHGLAPHGPAGAAPTAGGAHDEVLRQTDAGAESGTGVDAGLSAGTMAQDGIMGQVLSVTVAGDYKIDFTFTKAYKGTYPYRAAGRDVKGVYVRIDAKFTDLKAGASPSTRCDKLQLLQVLRNTQRGADGSVSTADPQDQTRRDRSGWGNNAAASRGWRVDTLTSSNAPYYTSTWVGNEGNATTPATMWDVPGDWSTTVNAGKDFQTSAVCLDSTGKRTVVGTVHWGYLIDGSGTIAFSPATPVAIQGNPIETKDAAQRWDAMPGNTATGITF